MLIDSCKLWEESNSCKVVTRLNFTWMAQSSAFEPAHSITACSLCAGHKPYQDPRTTSLSCMHGPWSSLRCMSTVSHTGAIFGVWCWHELPWIQFEFSLSILSVTENSSYKLYITDWLWL